MKRNCAPPHILLSVLHAEPFNRVHLTVFWWPSHFTPLHWVFPVFETVLCLLFQPNCLSFVPSSIGSPPSFLPYSEQSPKPHSLLQSFRITTRVRKIVLHLRQTPTHSFSSFLSHPAFPTFFSSLFLFRMLSVPILAPPSPPPTLAASFPSPFPPILPLLLLRICAAHAPDFKPLAYTFTTLRPNAECIGKSQSR